MCEGDSYESVSGNLRQAEGIFDSDATKSYEWRIDQLTRLENLCKENAEVLEAAMSSDFKTASQEKVFEIMAL